MVLGDFRTGDPGDWRTTGTAAAAGPVTVNLDPAVLTLVALDPLVTIGGVAVLIELDPAVLELVALDPEVTVGGPITVDIEPAVLLLEAMEPAIYGGGRSRGDHALLMTVGL